MAKQVELDEFGYKKKKERKSFKTRFLETIHLYDEMRYAKETKNDSTSREPVTQYIDKAFIDFTCLRDGDNIVYFYVFSKYPKDIPIDYRDRIRRECKGNVRVTFLNNLSGHKIAWNSAQMTARLNTLRQVGKDNENRGIDAYNLHENIGSLGRQDWIENSLAYLAEADITRGRSLMKSTITMIVSGKCGEEFDNSVKRIEEYCNQIGIGLTRVLYDIPDFIRCISPFSQRYLKNIDDITPKNVLTDEIVARFNSYNQGTLGIDGVYFGTDIYSRFPVLKRVKPADDTAENWLITAETGGGKSFIVKELIMELSARGYNGTIMDIEGFEYIPFANFMSKSSKVQIINLAEGSGRYFDPVEIADPTGIEDIDKDAKTMSVNFTIAMFKVLLGKAYDEDIWLDTVVNDAVSEAYKDMGVSDDANTWSYSKGHTLFDVYDSLKRIKHKREDRAYESAVEKAKAITGKYFEPDGNRNSIFREKVVVSDIVDADLVVCSFGMAGKSPQAVDETQLALMQLGAAQFSHQRSIFSKSQGKYNYKLWEEFQRWGKFPDSDKTLGVAITGGRKLGDVNIIITNVVKELLEDDRFGIFGNVTSFLCGAIGDEKVRREFCERMSIPNMLPELDKISTEGRITDEQNNSESPYRFAFLCGLDRSKYGTIKMIIPQDIRGTSLFKTGVNKKQTQSDTVLEEV